LAHGISPRRIFANTVFLVFLATGFFLLDPGDAEAVFELGEHILGFHPLLRPQHQQVIEEIGTLAHDFLRRLVECGDDHLDRLFAGLLGDLALALLEQLGGVRHLRIGAAAAFDHLVEFFQDCAIRFVAHLIGLSDLGNGSNLMAAPFFAM
jgi:hypothetical protein